MIDKTFLLAFWCDRFNGFYHWSNVINTQYQSTIRESLKSTLPTGQDLKITVTQGMRNKTTRELLQQWERLNLIKETQDLDALRRMSTVLKVRATDTQELISLCEVALFNRFLQHVRQENHELKVNKTFANSLIILELFTLVNLHNHSFDNKSNEYRKKAILNYNVLLLLTTASSPKFTKISLEGVDDIMEPVRDIIKAIPVDALFHPKDYSYVATMNNITLVGKKDVGISANGHKSYLAISLANNIVNDLIENVKYIAHLTELLLPKPNGILERRIITTTADADLSHTIKSRIESLYLKILSPSERISYFNNDLGVVNSTFINLSVDNAKEFGLYAINGDETLLNIHLALSVLGCTNQEIADFCTTKEFKKFKSILTRNLSTTGVFHKGRPSLAILQRLIGESTTTKEKVIYESILRVAMFGAEQTQLSLLLGINQGSKAEPKKILSLQSNIRNLIKNRLLWFDMQDGLDGLAEQVAKYHGFEDNEAYINLINREINALKNKSFNDSNITKLIETSIIDTNLFFNDETYRNAVIDFYNIITLNVNIPYVLFLNKGYFAQYLTFNETLQSTNNNPYLNAELNLFEDVWRPDIINNYKTEDDDPYADPNMPIDYFGQTAFKIKRNYVDNLAGFRRIYAQHVFKNTLDKYGESIRFTVNGNNTFDLQTNAGQKAFMNMMVNILDILKYQSKYANNGFLQFLEDNSDSYIYINGKPLVVYGLSQMWNVLYEDATDDLTKANLVQNVLNGLSLLQNLSLTDLSSIIGTTIEMDADFNFGDLLTIYSELLNCTTLNGKLNLTPLLKSSELSSFQLELQKTDAEQCENIINTMLKDRDLMAQIVSYTVRKKELNRRIKYKESEKYQPKINKLDDYILLIDPVLAEDPNTELQALNVINLFAQEEVSVYLDEDNYYLIGKNGSKFTIKHAIRTNGSENEEFFENLRLNKEALNYLLNYRLKPWLTHTADTKLNTVFSKLRVIKSMMNDLGIKLEFVETDLQSGNVTAYYDNGTIYVQKPQSNSVRTGDEQAVITHELMHIILGYLLHKDYKRYMQFINKFVPYVSSIKYSRANDSMENRLSYLEVILKSDKYINLTYSEQVEEAALQLLQDVISNRVSSSKDLLKEGMHFWELFEGIHDVIEELFGIKIPTVGQFLQMSFLDIPIKQRKEIALNSESFTEKEVLIHKQKLVTALAQKWIEKGIITQEKC